MIIDCHDGSLSALHWQRLQLPGERDESNDDYCDNDCNMRASLKCFRLIAALLSADHWRGSSDVSGPTRLQ